MEYDFSSRERDFGRIAPIPSLPDKKSFDKMKRKGGKQRVYEKGNFLHATTNHLKTER
jgi:hypothetical protein